MCLQPRRLSPLGKSRASTRCKFVRYAVQLLSISLDSNGALRFHLDTKSHVALRTIDYSTSSASLIDTLLQTESGNQTYNEVPSMYSTIVHSNVSRHTFVPLYDHPMIPQLNDTGISQFICDQNEEVTAVCALDKLDTSNPLFSTQKPSFCIGTVRHVPGEREPSSGRIIVFREPVSGSEVNRLSVLAKIDTEGCVWALDVVNDMIVAAINSSVSHTVCW